MKKRLDSYELHHGPYHPPPLHRGDRATCLFRDGDVIVTGWSDARIPWPRCRRLDTHGGGSGLLVDEELARAIRLESSLAIQHWFGVNNSVVWRWRKALCVPRFNEGSARLQTALNVCKGAAKKGKHLSPEQVEQRRRTAKELGLRLPPREDGWLWTQRELDLLGTLPDAEVAARIDRTEIAVRVMRLRQGIRSAQDRRRREHRGNERTGRV
jgi:hypothetical protein